MKIGIVVGSIREGRLGESVGAWVAESAGRRDTGHTYELIDLKSFDVPLLTSPDHPMSVNKSYGDGRVQAWSGAIDACDAYVFVTPEYNHGVPGALKNAVDSLGSEWSGKVVGFVGYGSVGGVRSIEQWRQIIVNFSMVSVRAEANLNIFTDFKDGTFTPQDRHGDDLKNVLDQVEQTAAAQGR